MRKSSIPKMECQYIYFKKSLMYVKEYYFKNSQFYIHIVV